MQKHCIIFFDFSNGNRAQDKFSMQTVYVATERRASGVKIHTQLEEKDPLVNTVVLFRETAPLGSAPDLLGAMHDALIAQFKL